MGARWPLGTSGRTRLPPFQSLIALLASYAAGGVQYATVAMAEAVQIEPTHVFAETIMCALA